MEFNLSLSMLDASTATQQQIAAHLDAQLAESIDAQRRLRDAIDRQHAAERLALEARCGELGHVFKKPESMFAMRDDFRCCAICGAAAPKAA